MLETRSHDCGGHVAIAPLPTLRLTSILTVFGGHVAIAPLPTLRFRHAPRIANWRAS